MSDTETTESETQTEEPADLEFQETIVSQDDELVRQDLSGEGVPTMGSIPDWDALPDMQNEDRASALHHAEDREWRGIDGTGMSFALPADDEVQAGPSSQAPDGPAGAEPGGGEAYDPADPPVAEVQDHVEQNPAELEAVLEAESSGKKRTTLLDWLYARQDAEA